MRIIRITTNKKCALLLLFMVVALSIVVLPSNVAFASHQCIGDPEWDAQNDMGYDHNCVPVSSSGSGGKIKTFEGLLGRLSSAVNSLVPFIIGLAVFVIIWGIFTYITKAGDEEKRTQARQFILWGVIGLFFMLSVWGFVNILLNSLDLDRTIKASDIPRVPTIGGGGVTPPSGTLPPEDEQIGG